MIIQIAVGIAYSSLVVILCFAKPNAGRIFLGFFFIAMGIGVNLTFVLVSPTFVADYGRAAWFPLYRMLTELIIVPSPVIFGILLIIFEVTMGILLLSEGKWVKFGLIGTMVFIAGLAPIHIAQVAWAGSIAGHIYCLTKEFDTSFITMVSSRFRKKD